MTDITGILTRHRGRQNRYRIGLDSGCVFHEDDDFDGRTLTVEVYSDAEALRMVDALKQATGWYDVASKPAIREPVDLLCLSLRDDGSPYDPPRYVRFIDCRWSGETWMDGGIWMDERNHVRPLYWRRVPKMPFGLRDEWPECTRCNEAGPWILTPLGGERLCPHCVREVEDELQDIADGINGF